MATDRGGGCGSWGLLVSGSRIFEETTGKPGQHVHHNPPPSASPCLSHPDGAGAAPHQAPEALEEGG